MPVTVTLAGPAPWGFRITGGRDFGKPITVSKVMERGKAAAGDLRPGDTIVSINGESTAEMLNVEAQNKIKQSLAQLQLQVERSPMSPLSHTNGDTSPEMLSTRFQAVLRMQDENQGTPRASCSNPASLIPLPGSTRDPQPGAPPAVPAGSCHAGEKLGDRELGCFPHHPDWSQDARGRPVPPRHGFGRLLSPVGQPLAPGLASPSSPPSFLGSEPAMRRLEEDSEVYKMLQENRELRAAPRQSSTFRMLQEALEEEGGGGPAAPFPSRLSPSARKPTAGVQKVHICEKCGSTIA
ncbi:PDZ and LIM domain protein 2 [Cuculus canorus]|uniref:PDZ and LIM domain protein 2 n=1 Tax=Cuculus canorus TaxID=55661 RepID=A0A091FQW1_CUCCA|nr:PDZ and LIM domain protein 2 [Cuculus canorus]